MADALTFRFLVALDKKAPPEVRQEIADGGMRGLYLVRQPSGAMSWAVRYRFAGKPCKFTIGTYPAFGLAEARQAAGKVLRAVEEGKNPGAAKQAQKAAQRGGEPAVDRDLIENVAADFLKRAVGKNKSAKLVQAYFATYILPAWSKRRIQDIGKRDIIELVDAIAETAPYQANRIFATIRRLFNWCVERSILDISPCAGLKPPATETARDRVLTDEEIKVFWKATESVGEPFGAMFKLLLLTGQRREEVAGMRRAEIDGADWTLPPDRAKNATAHLVPLSSAAQSILKAVRAVSGPAGFIFTTSGRTPVSGFSRAKERLDAIMRAIMAAEAGITPDDVELQGWRIHDLRRTCATGLARLRVSPHIIEAVLNHRSGQISGVARVYNRFSYEPEKRAALEAWSRYLTDLVQDRPAGNVVELGRRP